MVGRSWNFATSVPRWPRTARSRSEDGSPSGSTPANGGSGSPASYACVTSASRSSAFSRATSTVCRVTDTCTRAPSSAASAQHITVMKTAAFHVRLTIHAGGRGRRITRPARGRATPWAAAAPA